MKIAVLNGPNLNFLGKRASQHYGNKTLAQINQWLEQEFPVVKFTFFQSNHEGALIDKLYEIYSSVDGIVLNAGAYSHTSYALRDALEVSPVPVIEVHLSNIYAREAFRSHSVLSGVCVGVIAGMQEYSYWLAVKYLCSILSTDA